MTHKLGQVLRLIWKGIKSFGMFWKNFLVGDSPEIAIGVFIILVIALFLHQFLLYVEIFIPLAAISLLVGTVLRKTRQ